MSDRATSAGEGNRDIEDYFVEIEASRGNYLWKYRDVHGNVQLTHNAGTVQFRKDVFGLDYTIVSYGDPNE